ncbi:aldehyde oxidoreductase molybdenum-binding subunit PaoC [Amaricoccus solimangrovi]|uniref:Xanthine dehydrogenase family protein molybdopterin-binding subunit n=1 Tax=Amaricoccus solimangrovi TaxID=2589815 RepID=A0A501WRW6_9RHOB|nr:aldehyde oxidoreductase molybdenum-binding subunit PaoC [Amaricoccus solimangrovi]TPE49751.1 xanthine dehydrogenase family protein molybdopterin-binding subunit [Amaricoccus solimangrovi]
MLFDTPAKENPIDRAREVGQPRPRIDGPLKVSGTARYAYEQRDVVENMAYGYPLGAAIAKGRVRAIDTAAAEAAPGVIGVLTTLDVPRHALGPMNTAMLFGGDRVEHYHQAIAVVVAESFEEARAATALLDVDYAPEPGCFDLERVAREIVGQPFCEDDALVGDFDDAFLAAPVQLDVTYRTPDQSHSMMEPHATLAAWEGDELTVWTSNQMIAWGVRDLAAALDLPRDKVRLVSPFIGGGFGGKLFVRSDVVAASLAARKVGRPVKLALPRPLIANNTTHRPATVQRLRFGATEDGKFTAFGHESTSGNLPDGGPETATQQSQFLYAAPNRLVGERLGVLDLPEGNAMRAPGEASGMMALEAAVDEMAEKLGLDPIEFRILNDTQVVPGKDTPFSQRHLADCLRLGADRFGWGERASLPARRREGRSWIGIGVAAAYRNNLLMKSGARARLQEGGGVEIETDMTDIGTGSYTIIAQTAAEMMGVPLARVTVRLGDSRYPVSAGSGGQFGGNSSTSGVYAACVALRTRIAERLGADPETAVFEEGEVRWGNSAVSLVEAASGGEIVAEDSITFKGLGEKYRQSTFGAHFVEVAVDAATAEIRVRRMLAVCSAGRILNPVTARSQVIGAMTMGVGSALMEELAVDKTRGFFANHDLAGYEVPVHADIPRQDVIFLDETDPISSPMKAKGVGELGLCGVAAAVANAVYNATGIRVRDFPITLDKLLPHMPPF